jgi:glucan biosynthesis protein
VSVSAMHGRIGPARAYRGPFENSWCIAFDFEPEDQHIAELRASLQAGEHPLTEIWSFAWPR